MKDTVEQIVEKYIANPSRENMHQIAEYNDCTIKEIGQHLKEAATPGGRKPGRPKGRKSSSTEPTIKHTYSKKSNKSGSNESDNLAKRYLIPPIVESMAKEKAEDLKKLRDIHEAKAKELQLEIDEIVDFLNGGIINGAKE